MQTIYIQVLSVKFFKKKAKVNRIDAGGIDIAFP